MLDGQVELVALSRERLLVEPALQDRVHALVGFGADREGAAGCRLETLLAVGFGEFQNTDTGAEALLGVSASSDDALGQFQRSRANFLGPTHDALGRPVGILAVGLRHVLPDGRVMAAPIASNVGGDAAAAIRRCTIA